MAEQLNLMPRGSDPQLILGAPSPRYGDFLTLLAELTATGLVASTDVLILSGNDLADFFAHLAEAWRGWEGERRWESLERDMSLAATHDGIGHVRLRVTLWKNFNEDAWSASATFVVDAGEDLRRLAADMAAFFSPDNARSRAGSADR